MSFTPGQLIGAVIGAAVGWFFPPAGYAIYSASVAMAGASIGMFVGGIIDPVEGQTIKQTGARLNDLSTQTSEWGIPIKRLFGTYKMAGNIIWSLDLHETKHVEESGEGKGGGGTKTETTWYSYAGSWAVGFCEGEIVGVTKIWFDSVLVYDGTDYSGGLSYTNHTIYLGNSTQEIDWYMQSKNSDTPAYRNLCYIVFNDIELENYGNRIPNVSCEISKDGISQGIFLNTTDIVGDMIPSFGQYRSWCLNASPDNYETVRIYNPDSHVEHHILLVNGDTAIGNGDTVTVDYRAHLKSFDGSIQALHGDYYAWLGSRAYTDGLGNYWAGSGLPVQIDYKARMYRANDKVYILTSDIGNSSNFNFLVELPQVIDSNVPKAIILYSGHPWDLRPFEDGYVLLSSDHTIKRLDHNFIEFDSFDISEYTLRFSMSSGNGQCDVIGIENDIVYLVNGSFDFYACSLIDKDIQHIGFVSIVTSASLHDISRTNAWHIENGRIYNFNIRDGTDKAYYNTFLLSLFESNQVTVGSIVNELLLRAGLDQNDFDISEGTDLVNGYVLPNSMDTRSAISTLISAYRLDLIESNSKLILKKRGSLDIDVTIPKEDIINFLKIDRFQTVELSRAINILYTNKDNNYDIGSQSAFRNDSNTENTKTYQYPLALNDTEAKQLAEMYLYSEWNERLEFEFSLPSEYINLVPSNIINIENEGKIFTARLTKIDHATNKQINVKASLENPIVYDSSAIGSDTGIVDYVIKIAGPTDFELLDIPMLDNLYDKEGIYIAANGYLDGWNGCGIDKSIDSEVTYSGVGSITTGTLLGTAITALPSGKTTVWDTNSITVSMINGSLYSNSMEVVLNGLNYLLIGNEIIQYMDSTDNGDGTFLLENLLRGRRGTEWAIDTHAIGDRVVSLSSNMMFDSTASLNVNAYYKATTFGDFIEDSISKYIAPEIICLKPLSISYLKGERDGSNNLTISWNRRSRDVTGHMKRLDLFEETESYEIYIVDADITYESTTEDYVYSDAQQLIDISGHVSGDPVLVIIYQMSGIVGRGYGIEGTI